MPDLKNIIKKLLVNELEQFAKNNNITVNDNQLHELVEIVLSSEWFQYDPKAALYMTIIIIHNINSIESKQTTYPTRERAKQSASHVTKTAEKIAQLFGITPESVDLQLIEQAIKGYSYGLHNDTLTVILKLRKRAMAVYLQLKETIEDFKNSIQPYLTPVEQNTGKDTDEFLAAIERSINDLEAILPSGIKPEQDENIILLMQARDELSYLQKCFEYFDLYMETIELGDHTALVEMGGKIAKIVAHIEGEDQADSFLKDWNKCLSELIDSDNGIFSLQTKVDLVSELTMLARTMTSLKADNLEQLIEAKSKLESHFSVDGLQINKSNLQQLFKTMDPMIIIASILTLAARYSSDSEYEVTLYADTFSISARDLSQTIDKIVLALGFDLMPKQDEKGIESILTCLSIMTVEEREGFISRNSGTNNSVLEEICIAASEMNAYVTAELQGFSIESGEDVTKKYNTASRNISSVVGKLDKLKDCALFVEIADRYQKHRASTRNKLNH